jgi:cyclase
LSPVEIAIQSVSRGAGEIMLTSIAKEGTFRGFDIPLFNSVTSAVDVPVIGHGGASNLDDFRQAVQDGGCSAVAAASMFVYAREGEGVLINYTEEQDLMNNFWDLLT